MKKISLLSLIIISLSFSSCNKSDDPGTDNFTALKTEVLTDFSNVVAVPGYADLNNAATALNTAIQNLNTNATEANLTEAKNAWKNIRSVWEKCEGYLFGPVEDNDYDPNMDTWPTDYVQMDSLLASSNALTLNDIKTITLSLRGYHPIEYIIFGNHGDRTAASITARQKAYMVSLATDIKNTCNELYLSWTTAPTNFAQRVKNAGNGSTVYAKKQEAYLAIVEALIGICEEVGEGKMKEPYDALDPSIVESPYSGNSVSDFKDNIIGLQNVYLGKYASGDGKGLNDLVASKNISLDNTLQNQMTAAINSFDNITVYYEQAIISQRIQCQQTMTALATLKTTLENNLKPFIIQNIQD
ncbi:MAG TPA: imelysin family protein [Ferruginibacter sp.]|nr:imelysin family protein [Ferruginibacter sp.]